MLSAVERNEASRVGGVALRGFTPLALACLRQASASMTFHPFQTSSKHGVFLATDWGMDEADRLPNLDLALAQKSGFLRTLKRETLNLRVSIPVSHLLLKIVQDVSYSVVHLNM